MSKSTDTMEKIVALCRRRGFIFGSSEIYGGIGGFWDYGPLGVELKRNIKDAWWKDMVHTPPPGPNGREYQMVGVDCSIIMNPKVWEASGHVGGFSDPMVGCKTDGCKRLFRADKVFAISLFPPEHFGADALDKLRKDGWSSFQTRVAVSTLGKTAYYLSLEADNLPDACQMAPEVIAKHGKKHNLKSLKSVRLAQNEHPVLGHNVALATSDDGTEFACEFRPLNHGEFYKKTPCPACGGEITEPRTFNLMLETFIGALQDASSKAYLRPETAQGIFANFKNVMDTSRVKIPFGIAQVGKAFRNEINPRNYTFRSREFEQMEIEFFCHPNESMEWYEFWRNTRIKWYESLGIKSDKLRPRQQDEKELAHYSKACTDIEYLFPFSEEPQELEGVAHRGSFDLNQHGEFSRGDKEAFAVVDDETKEKFTPHVVEPSAGADRFTLAVLCEAYCFDESRASPEFMKFHPRLAPIKAAVFPLVAKDGLPEIAEPLYREIRRHFPCQYDAKQSIGKRYARMDEAGTPFCFTIDGQTKEDGTVTVRNRDDASQARIPKEGVLKYLHDKLGM